MVAHEQLVDLAEPQRARRAEPLHDALLVLGNLPALCAHVDERACLHPLRDLVDFRFAQRSIARQRELFGHRDVAPRGAAIGPRLPLDLPVAVPLRPAAKDLSYVNHG